MGQTVLHCLTVFHRLAVLHCQAVNYCVTVLQCLNYSPLPDCLPLSDCSPLFDCFLPSDCSLLSDTLPPHPFLPFDYTCAGHGISDGWEVPMAPDWSRGYAASCGRDCHSNFPDWTCKHGRVLSQSFLEWDCRVVKLVSNELSGSWASVAPGICRTQFICYAFKALGTCPSSRTVLISPG